MAQFEKESESESLSRVQLFVTPWTVACTRLLRPWDFLGKSTGLGCHFLFQGIFPTQESNPGLRQCRQTLPSEPQYFKSCPLLVTKVL